MSELFALDEFDDVVEYVKSLVGSEFEKSLALANAIIANPSQYTGQQATIAAIKVAGYRYKIGVVAQYWKQKSSTSGKKQDRLVKDELMVAYDALVELVNCLKLASRQESDLANSR